MSPPTLFFFKIVLAIQGPLSFFIHFRMAFSLSGKNIIEILLGIALNMQITLNTTNILLRNIKYVCLYLCLIPFNKVFSFNFTIHLLPRLSYYFLKFYLFIYFWLHWVFVGVHEFSPAAESRGYLLIVAHRLLVARLLLWTVGSGAQAQLPCSMWNLPGPGIKSVSPVLAGGFLTTGPPGKPNQTLSYPIYAVVSRI